MTSLPVPARLVGALIAVGLGAGIVVTGGVPTVDGGLSAGIVGNGSFSTAVSGLGDEMNNVAATLCDSSASSALSIGGGAQGQCSSFPLAPTAGGSQTVSVFNLGNGPASLTMKPAATCGVQQASDTSTSTWADATGSGDTGSPQGGAYPGAAGPVQFGDGPKGASFDGANGYMQTATKLTGPQTFSIAIWFQTTGYGSLMGFDSLQNNAAPPASGNDRLLWLGNAGRLNFGIGSNQFELHSQNVLADGAWHLAVITVTPTSSTTATVLMYVDGALLLGTPNDDTGITASQPALAYQGWWHVGWAYNNGWFYNATSNYFSGRLADAAVFPSALSASQVSQLYGAGTQSAFSTVVSNDSASAFWPMGENGPDPAIPNGGVTYGASGPSGLSGSPAALGLDGSTGYLETVKQLTAPQAFSIALWFKTSSDGSLMQFSQSETAGTGPADRALWLDSSGNLVLYLNPGTPFELATSGTNYANGSWHHVVATVAPGTGGLNATVYLYVDGAAKAGSANDDSAATSLPGSVSNGYWQLGYANGVAQSDPPASNRLSGSLSDVAVFGSALTSAQVSALAGANSQGAYEQLVLGDGPTAAWAMQDIGNALYTGLLDSVGSSAPCSYLGFTIAVSGGACVYPTANAGGCSGVTPASLSPSSSYTYTQTASNWTYATTESGSMPAAASGLHVSVPWVFSNNYYGWTGTLYHTIGYVQL